jgi:8-oxo-dGTP pyrophosphatase MutT (NUDIX family)
MPCKNFFSVVDGKISRFCRFGAKCNFSHKNEDCANLPCPMNVVDKINKDGVCKDSSCPYLHTGEIRKTFNYFGCEVKAAGILMYRKTKEGLEFMLINEAEKGYFSDAGGKLNVNDATPFDGAKREFKEETGCEFDQQITSQIYIPQAKYLLFFSEVAPTYQLENEDCKFMTFGIFRTVPRLEELPPINPRLSGCMPGFPISKNMC